MACNNNGDEQQQAFLDSLGSAREVSINLLAQRKPGNLLQGVFLLEVSSSSGKLDDKKTSNELHVMEKKGLRNPNSIWPLYTFSVAEEQSRFLLESLLPALALATSLEALTLQGCGRIPGFYTSLLEQVQHRSTLSAISILAWKDFCDSVDHDLAVSVLSKLNRFAVIYPKVDDASSRVLGEVLGRMVDVHSLQLHTGYGSDSFWGSMQQAMGRLDRLEDLCWIGKLSSEVVAFTSQEAVRQMCNTIGSRPRLTKLKLTWGRGMEASMLSGLLLGRAGETSSKLEMLHIDAVDDESSLVIAEYLKYNTALQSLQVAFGDDCNATVLLQQGIRKHPSLQDLTLSNVHLDKDASEEIQISLSDNGPLKGFTMSTTASDNENEITESDFMRDMLLGLATNNTLESVALHVNNCEIDYDTCLTLQHILLYNLSLRRLDLGRCQIVPGDCADIISQAIVENSTLKSLCGLHCNADASTFVDALEQNTTLLEFSPSLPSMEFYLQLNRLGRKHMFDPNFDAAKLLPFVLKKASRDQVQYLLQARAEVFMN
jgi:hypothetical protein